MTEDSGFLTPLQEESPAADGMELLHRSESGWSELYLLRADGRLSVLKALKPEFRGRSMYERLLLKEHSITSQLHHPNIREAYAYRSTPQLGNVIELEWVDGLTLEEYLGDGRPPRKQSLDLALQLCEALSYIHSNQIVHRDIKPANMLVSRNGGKLKLIDFGLSDADSWAEFKGAVGTRQWAAPEVLDGGHGDWRSDIWSLGKVLSELLSGHRRVLRQCLDPNPSGRPGSAQQVMDALQKAMPVWPFLLAAALATGTAALSTLGSTPEGEPAEQETTDTTSARMLENPEIIDELFQQATEMIEGQYE